MPGDYEYLEVELRKWIGHTYVTAIRWKPLEG